jgi:hypothetical protein
MAHEAGKGSRPRPYSVSKEEFDNRFDLIFGKKKKVEDNTGTDKNEYQDILSTEDAIVDVDLEEYKRQAQEVWNDSCTAPRKK